MQTININDAKIKKIGTVNVEYNKTAFLQGSSGFALRFVGSSLRVDFSFVENSKANYCFSVSVDGRDAEKIKIGNESENSYSTELANGEHTVKFLRCSESNLGCVFVDAITTDGEFLPHGIAEKKRKIEVLGDSISCGFGNLWNGEELTDGFAPYEDATQTFATMLADRFDADYRVEAISGVGLARNIGGPKGSGGAHGLFVHCNTGDAVEKDWCFKPDVLVIELGTNDRDSEDDEMQQAVEKILTTARNAYPDAYIVWYNGLMDVKHNPNIAAVIDKMNDKKISYVFSETMESLGERIGLWGHPTVEVHKRVADELESHISKLTGWTTVK